MSVASRIHTSPGIPLAKWNPPTNSVHGTQHSLGLAYTRAPAATASISSIGWALPFFVNDHISIDRIGMNVTTGIGSVILVLFSADDYRGTDSFGPQPSDVLEHFGTLGTNTNGVKELTLSPPVNISPGQYFIGIQSSSGAGPTVRGGLPVGGVNVFQQSPQINFAQQWELESGELGAQIAIPQVFMRVATVSPAASHNRLHHRVGLPGVSIGIGSRLSKTCVRGAALTVPTMSSTSANAMVLVPFRIPVGKVLDTIAIRMTSGGTGTGKVGIYSHGDNGPDELMYTADLGGDLTSTGNKSVTSLGWYLPAGVYWAAVIRSDAASGVFAAEYAADNLWASSPGNYPEYAFATEDLGSFPANSGAFTNVTYLTSGTKIAVGWREGPRVQWSTMGYNRPLGVIPMVGKYIGNQFIMMEQGDVKRVVPSGNELLAHQFYMERPFYLIGLGLSMSSGAGGEEDVDIGWYDSDDDGYPRNLLVSVSFSLAGGDAAVSPERRFEPGKYWCATVTTGNAGSPEHRTWVPSAPHLVVMSNTLAGNQGLGNTSDASLPDPFSSGATSRVCSLSYPVVRWD